MSNLILIAGGTGEGKTSYLNKSLLYNSPNRSNNRVLYSLTEKSRNQYIFDINNEYLLPTDEILRTKMRHIQADKKRFVENCSRIINCNIVFEDASGFLRGKQTDDIIKLIVRRRHVNNNWIILFHSINRIPPELMEYCNYFILFRTNDSLKDIDLKFKNPKINAMFEQVAKSKKYNYAFHKFL